MRWIVTDDIYVETWRNLLEFANIDLALDAIRNRHGVAVSRSEQENHRKQARQARVCALQAKEYFDAARSSSLYTSPNHAYYGAVSLASLAMLILGDGTKSLDYLRSDNKNNHHGLDLTTACSARTAATGTTLLERTAAEALKHGHFPNWYRTLPKRGSAYAFVRRDHGGSGSINYAPSGSYRVQDYSCLESTATSLIDLLKYLPDLDADLSRVGLTAPRSRTHHDIHIGGDGTERHTWRVHGCRTPDELDLLLGKFTVCSRFVDALSCKPQEGRNAAVVSLVFKRPAEIGFSWPNSRQTLNHDEISYADDRDTHEIVDLYMVAYQLSMLSRYFPDIWIACIESQCRAAKLIERAVEIIVKKLPILALSQLEGEDVVISTHREPWKD